MSVAGSHSAGCIACRPHHSDDGQVASYTECSEIPLKFAFVTYCNPLKSSGKYAWFSIKSLCIFTELTPVFLVILTTNKF